MRILYIQRGLVPPPKDDRLDHFLYLSEAIQGDILLPVWWVSQEEAEAELGPGSYPVHRAAAFRYHLLLAGNKIGLRARLDALRFYVRKGRAIHREQPFDCIVTYGFSLTALAGILIKWFTGTKLILEINSEPGKAYLYDISKPKLVRRIQSIAAVVCLHLAAWCSDGLRLLYPTQVAGFPLLNRVPVSIFHPFVPTSMATPAPVPEDLVFFVGYPWYLKGADVMIQAFRRIAAEFPGVKLILCGHYPDRTELERMVGDCAQIEIRKPLPYSEMLSTIGKALVLAHPSRTEGMSRVLIEGLAAGRPCVASAVGGIPYYFQNERNGLVARSGDVDDLADKLRRLLGDPTLRQRLSVNALEFVRSRLTENDYVKAFVQMLARTTAR
jgi:glycosyltransferase involved in cell wall biosynthesis